MQNRDSKKADNALSDADCILLQAVSRRNFLMYTGGLAAALCMGGVFPCVGLADSGMKSAAVPVEYSIDPHVVTTVERTLLFAAIEPGLKEPDLPKISQYSMYGYGNHAFGPGLSVVRRTDLMAQGGGTPEAQRTTQLASFFSFTDVHITDKESPNQLILNQQLNPLFYFSSSIYSPVMLYSTQVLDAAIQTVNALHKKSPFDFGISLGDVCNTAQYNELRWYIDVFDGKVITPCSGSLAGVGSIDYQMPFKAAGLDKSIPWYQTLGNHDHFWMGSFPVHADSSLGLAEAYTSGEVMAAGLMSLDSGGAHFPCLYDVPGSLRARAFYMGLIDGATPDGAIIGAGPKDAYATPPKTAADPNRHPVSIAQWKQEFFDTATEPVGHGFHLVDPALGSGFACYSFVPRAVVPLKVIVLDNTQSETDGSHDIHGHGFLDAARLKWLKQELASGQAADQLMIIAAHIPIGVSAIGTEMEWWESNKDPNAVEQNATSLQELVNMLWDTPNLLMWISGHRHFNTVKAFPSPDASTPEKGFWQVETASLRDFPQQFRTFQIYLNSDYTVSIITINVDPAVAEGTPAAKSRYYSIAAQQVLLTNLTVNAPNVAKYARKDIVSMDPSRPQNGEIDPTIQWQNVPGYGPFPSLQDGQYGSPAHLSHAYPSYNAELLKQLSPAMVKVLKNRYGA